ncbi:MAG: rRNA pseudouridine synthase, partial [Deltaproteobacteria bacterium]|nr:rRNA pseudouridine synthase [Deltaproteobacteria bacterium]
MSERLQKYLARAGVASRRHAEGLITAGRVTVNNKRVTELGSKVEKGDLVAVDGKLVTPSEDRTYVVLYKPAGVITTLDDPQGRPTVGDYVKHLGKRLFPVGRLDYDAEGALLLTDDGDLAQKLTHPSYEVERTYLAKVKGEPDDATLEKLRGGVRLEDGMATPVSVDVFEQAERNTWIKLVVSEGRPHLIKRLCAAVGHPVVRLFRPVHGGVSVDGMSPGDVRNLSRGELELALRLAEGAQDVFPAEIKLPARRHGHGPQLPQGYGEEAPEEGGYKAPRHKQGSKERAPRAERPTPKQRGERTGAFGGRRERAGSGFRAREESESSGRSERPMRGGFGEPGRGPGGLKARGEGGGRSFGGRGERP